MTFGVYPSSSFVDCNHFQMGCFVVAGFVLTSASHGPSAIPELLVQDVGHITHTNNLHYCVGLFDCCQWMQQVMSELQAVLEFQVELFKFFNIDLFQRGLVF